MPNGADKRKARELQERLRERGSTKPDAKPGGNKTITKTREDPVYERPSDEPED
jgi:hypothetical protein